MKATLAILWLFFVGMSYAVEYEHSQQLDDGTGNPVNYFLYWSIVEDVIQLKISAQTTGWIGFGLSPEGTMVNSDVFLGWVSDDGETFFDDRWAVQYSEPIKDVNMVPSGEENLQLVSISGIDGWTTIEFSRPLNTGDQWDVAVGAGATTVIWAMGYQGDNPKDGRISRHEFRAVNTVTFATTSAELPDIMPAHCSGASARKFYSGDSSEVLSLRTETLAGSIKLSSGAVSNIAVNVIKSAYDDEMLSSVETQFYSPESHAWVVTAGRGDASLSTPSTTTGPSSGSSTFLNTTIGNNECVGADMSIVMPSEQGYTHVTAYTHEGDVHLNNLDVSSALKVKTNGGVVYGDMTINSDHKISIESEWSEVSFEVERSLDFEGKEKLRVLVIGFAGNYDVSTAPGFSLLVTGDMVTPTSGGPDSEQGYVGFAGQSTSINVTATCDVEVAFYHDADTLTVDLQMPTYNVPTRRTSYICTNVELPAQSDTHIIRIDPIIDQTAVLHHMTMFICDSAQEAKDPWDCSDMDPECTSMLYVWAVGGSNFYLPQEAGFPMGPNGAQYAILQIHYDNPDHMNTIYDTSGFRLYYTPNLREYDAGIVEVGLDKIAIPPGEEAYTVGDTYFGCPSECTEENIPEGTEITVFASMLHAHLAGRQIYTEHFRNGTQIEDLNNNPYFDFNVQSYDLFNPPKSIMPGDSLVTYCVYNTEDRDEITYFGLSTYEEMCWNFIAYYPLGAWSFCFGETEHTAYCDDLTAVNSWDA